jgi:hypothetical protein
MVLRRMALKLKKEEEGMKNYCLILVLLTFLSVGFISADAKASLAIATFADPSGDSNNPLFTVDFINMKLTGGWADAKTGLTLEIPYSGNTFTDAWFEMTGEVTPEVVILNASGDTGGGEINFYADGTTTNPLITIIFESGYVDSFNFGADEFFGENVTISGIGITPGTLSEEEFSFAFANKALLPGSGTFNDGFTATASFTSSAVPEPATVCILGLGALSLLSRKKHK